MKKTTYVAVLPNNTIQTRASDSMRYTHALAVQGGAGGHSWGVYSWHMSEANALKAAGGRIRQHHARVLVVPVEAITLTGKALEKRLGEILTAVVEAAQKAAQA